MSNDLILEKISNAIGIQDTTAQSFLSGYREFVELLYYRLSRYLMSSVEISKSTSRFCMMYSGWVDLGRGRAPF